MYLASISCIDVLPAGAPARIRLRVEVFSRFVSVSGPDFSVDFRRVRDADDLPFLSMVIVGFTAVILEMELVRNLNLWILMCQCIIKIDFFKIFGHNIIFYVS